MDPAFKRMMAGRLPNGRFLYCPNGSHLAMYDDQDIYMAGLIDFLRDTDATPPATATPRSSGYHDRACSHPRCVRPSTPPVDRQGVVEGNRMAEGGNNGGGQ